MGGGIHMESANFLAMLYLRLNIEKIRLWHARYVLEKTGFIISWQPVKKIERVVFLILFVVKVKGHFFDLSQLIF